MTIGFMVQNKSMISHGTLLAKSLLVDDKVKVLVLVPEKEVTTIEILIERLASDRLQVIPFELPKELEKFPFADKVFASAKAESMTKGILLWMDVDSIFFVEPSKLILEEDKLIGYRPVDKKLIGSDYNKEISSFWSMIYKYFNLEDQFDPMTTSVDNVLIRPYINAGFLMVRCELGIFKLWVKYFLDLVYSKDIIPYYSESVLYKIFIHQAVLTGVILSRINQDDLQLLSSNVNYPIHLHNEHPLSDSIKSSRDLISCRYDTYFNHPTEKQLFEFCGEVKKYIDENKDELKLGWFYE